MKRIFPLLLALIMLLTLSACGQAGTDSTVQTITAEAVDMEIYCFQAGKADAFLISTDNSTLLIDCGEKGFGKTILEYMDEKGIEDIDYLIVTHFDKDHVGGAAKVINNVEIGTVLQSDYPKDSEEYEKYLTALETAGLESVTVSETMVFELDGLTIVVDGPDATDYKKDDSNNSSLIVSIYDGDRALLFAGDAQTERIEEFLDDNTQTYDLIKIPHHGQDEPLMEDLLEEVSPSYAIITSSEEEPESERTMDALSREEVEVFLTRVSPVLITCDGQSLILTYTQAD